MVLYKSKARQFPANLTLFIAEKLIKGQSLSSHGEKSG